ncbi:MAG TPA: hypothetical protein VKB59_23050 [Micromonosporaceae bacterium]|nr:hypothetical protein [Micromonosporaceae bacterium]
MSDVWEDAWETIGAAFQRLAESLRSALPALSCSAGHSDNSAFPFRAYAAFTGGIDEDVVVSVDFQRVEGGLRYAADIALDDGHVLDDGPTGIIHIGAGLQSASGEIDAVVDDIVLFIQASEPVIRSRVDSAH